MRKDIEGFEGLYAVDTAGDVWTIRHGANRKLKPMITGNKRKQYRTVALCKSGKQTRAKVGHLVLQAFAGPRPEGYVMRHLNDDSFDDRLGNLAWGTHAQNEKDKRDNGKCTIAKLTKYEVKRIKILLSKGVKCAAIAKDYRVTQWAIHDIKQGRTWRDV